MLDWSTIFEEAYLSPGATDAEIEQFVAALGQPLSQPELAAIRRDLQNPFPKSDPLYHTYQPLDPTRWVLPASPLSPDYLSLLRWSNGGELRTGERWFQFFPALDPVHGVRAMLLAYHVPEYLPGAVPFALNGGGVSYFFDVRAASVDGEYPICCADCGNLGWGKDECVQIASTFAEACRGLISE